MCSDSIKETKSTHRPSRSIKYAFLSQKTHEYESWCPLKTGHGWDKAGDSGVHQRGHFFRCENGADAAFHQISPQIPILERKSKAPALMIPNRSAKIEIDSLGLNKRPINSETHPDQLCFSSYRDMWIWIRMPSWNWAWLRWGRGLGCLSMWHVKIEQMPYSIKFHQKVQSSFPNSQ